MYAGVNVDGVSYRLLGNDEVPNVITAQQLAVDITATRTSFLFKAGGVEINATYSGTFTRGAATVPFSGRSRVPRAAADRDGLGGGRMPPHGSRWLVRRQMLDPGAAEGTLDARPRIAQDGREPAFGVSHAIAWRCRSCMREGARGASLSARDGWACGAPWTVLVTRSPRRGEDE